MQLAYKPGFSLFHKIDPVTKLIWTLVISFWLFSLTTPKDVLGVSTVVALFSVIGAKIRLMQYLKFVFAVMLGGLFIVFYQGLFRDGPGITFYGITFSYLGISIGISILLRTLGIVASAMAFSNTTSPQDLELGLEKVGVPYRFAHVFYLSLRFIPMFSRDLQHVQDAQKLRGVKKGVGAFKSSVISLVATELRHADETAIALETRGYGLHSTRTHTKEIHISKGGIFLVITTTILMILHLAEINILR